MVKYIARYAYDKDYGVSLLMYVRNAFNALACEYLVGHFNDLP